MKHKIISTSKARLLIVDNPEEWKFVAGKTENRFEGPYTSTSVAGEHIGRQKVYYLPPGNWQLLGKMEEVSEYDAFPLFDRNASTGLYNGFYSPKVALFDIIESEICLSNSLGEEPNASKYFNTNIPINEFKEKEDIDGLSKFNTDYMFWQAAEEKVFRNPILLYEPI